MAALRHRQHAGHDRIQCNSGDNLGNAESTPTNSASCHGCFINDWTKVGFTENHLGFSHPSHHCIPGTARRLPRGPQRSAPAPRSARKPAGSHLVFLMRPLLRTSVLDWPNTGYLLGLRAHGFEGSQTEGERAPPICQRTVMARPAFTTNLGRTSFPGHAPIHLWLPTRPTSATLIGLSVRPQYLPFRTLGFPSLHNVWSSNHDSTALWVVPRHIPDRRGLPGGGRRSLPTRGRMTGHAPDDLPPGAILAWAHQRNLTSHQQAWHRRGVVTEVTTGPFRQALQPEIKPS